jgi:transposase InsO family protein
LTNPNILNKIPKNAAQNRACFDFVMDERGITLRVYEQNGLRYCENDDGLYICAADLGKALNKKDFARARRFAPNQIEVFNATTNGGVQKCLFLRLNAAIDLAVGDQNVIDVLRLIAQRDERGRYADLDSRLPPDLDSRLRGNDEKGRGNDGKGRGNDGKGSVSRSTPENIYANEGEWKDKSDREIKAERIRVYNTIIANGAPCAYKALKEVLPPFLSRSLTKSGFYRDLRRFKAGGVDALENKRGKANAGRSILSDRQKEFVLNAKRASPKATYKRIHKDLLISMNMRGEVDYPAILTGRIKPPFSFRAIQRYLENHLRESPLEKAFLTYGADKARGRLLPAHGDKKAAAIERNYIWEVDSSPLDAIILVDGVQKRFDLLSITDVFSGRVVVALVEKSNALAIVRALWKAIDTFNGIPRIIRGDNGRDYLSERFQALLERLNIAYHKGRAYHGEDKPHVERFFGTVMRDRIRAVSGAIGANVGEREVIEAQKDKKERREAVSGKKGAKTTQTHLLTYEQMSEILQAAIKEWDLNGMDGRVSPLEKWNSCAAPLRKIEYFEFLAAAGARTVRNCGKKGVMLANRIYNSPELANIHGNVEARENIDNIAEIFVYSLKGEYIATAFDRTIRPITIEEAQSARNAFEKEYRNVKKTVAAAKDWQAQWLEDLREWNKEVLDKAHANYLKDETYEIGSSGVKRAIEEDRRREKYSRSVPNIPIVQTTIKPKPVVSWEKAVLDKKQA